MLNLPINTNYGKRIPKTKFYQHLSLSNKVKQQFVDEIDTITWQNKLSPTTLGVAPGEHVSEIEVFELKLHQKGISKNILEIMDRQIPYHIVFVLTFDGMAQLVIGYKEKNIKKNDPYRVEKYVYSEWLSLEELAPELKGLNLDTIYENLLRGLIPEEQPQLEDLGETIALQKEIEKQTALCDALETKMNREKQFNMQVRLNQELRKQKAKLEGLLSEQNN
jgi:hypothetical protein